jgi:hypothetical protein
LDCYSVVKEVAGSLTRLVYHSRWIPNFKNQLLDCCAPIKGGEDIAGIANQGSALLLVFLHHLLVLLLSR